MVERPHQHTTCRRAVVRRRAVVVRGRAVVIRGRAVVRRRQRLVPPRGGAVRGGGTPRPLESASPSGPGGEARSSGDAWSGSSSPRAGDAWSSGGSGARSAAPPRGGDPRASGATSRSGRRVEQRRACRGPARPGAAQRALRRRWSLPLGRGLGWPRGAHGPARRRRRSRPAARLTTYSGRELSMMQLSERADDPGLSVLREPDGELATSIRVFVTRLLESAADLRLPGVHDHQPRAAHGQDDRRAQPRPGAGRGPEAAYRADRGELPGAAGGRGAGATARRRPAGPARGSARRGRGHHQAQRPQPPGVAGGRDTPEPGGGPGPHPGSRR